MNKKILITGASRGLGREMALLFAANNYTLYLNYYKNDAGAYETQELCEKYGANVTLLKYDIKDEEAVKAMFAHIDHLDCVINNAALAIDNNYLDKTANEFNEVLATNLTGTFLVSKYASLKMNNGVIINISSTNAIDTNYINSMDYDASKAGVISLTHNFAAALAPKIRVNCIVPGWINTDSVKEMDPKYLDSEKNKIMLEKFADPIEIAELAFFLATDKASHINDSIIRIDGGIKK